MDSLHDDDESGSDDIPMRSTTNEFDRYLKHWEGATMGKGKEDRTPEKILRWWMVSSLQSLHY